MTKTETLLREIVLKQDEIIIRYRSYAKHLLIPVFNRKAISKNFNMAWLLIKDDFDSDIRNLLDELSALKASLEEEEKKKLYPGVWYM